MLKYENNYINLVVLGSFNPAILTHDFLVRECGLDLPSPPQRKVPPTPIPLMASLVYDKLLFFADLTRLEIKEQDSADPKSSKIPGFLEVYLNKLPYTPITKCGANFSYIVTATKARLDEVESWLRKDRSKLCALLRRDLIGLEVAFEAGKADEVLKHWTLCTTDQAGSASTKLKVKREPGEKIRVDFNYEIDGLESDRQRSERLTKGYADVYDVFRQQVERIFGE